MTRSRGHCTAGGVSNSPEVSVNQVNNRALLKIKALNEETHSISVDLPLGIPSG